MRMHNEPRRFVLSPENIHRIDGRGGRRRDLGQQSVVRVAEAQLAIGLSFDLVALFMDRAVMATAQKGEIGERGGPPLRPVPDVMTLAEPHAAAREATAPVPML